MPPVVFDWGTNLTRNVMRPLLAMRREPGAIARRDHRKTVISAGVTNPRSAILVLAAMVFMVFTLVRHVARARGRRLSPPCCSVCRR